MCNSVCKRGLSLLLVVALVLSLVPVVFAADAPKSDDIVILYSNDVHTYIDNTKEDAQGNAVPALS